MVSSQSKTVEVANVLGTAPMPWFLKAEDLYEVVKRSLSDVTVGDVDVSGRAIAIIEGTTSAISKNILHVSNEEAGSMVNYLDNVISTNLTAFDGNVDCNRAKLATSLVALEESILSHKEHMEHVVEETRTKTMQVVSDVAGRVDTSTAKAKVLLTETYETTDDYIRVWVGSVRSHYPQATSALMDLLGLYPNDAVVEENLEFVEQSESSASPSWKVSAQELIEVLKRVVLDASKDSVVLARRSVDIVSAFTVAIRQNHIAPFALEVDTTTATLRVQVEALKDQVKQMIDQTAATFEGQHSNVKEEVRKLQQQLWEALGRLQDLIQETSAALKNKGLAVKESTTMSIQQSVTCTEKYVTALVNQFKLSHPEATARFVEGLSTSTAFVNSVTASVSAAPLNIQQQVISQAHELVSAAQPSVQNLVDNIAPYAAPAVEKSTSIITPLLTHPLVEPYVHEAKKILDDNAESVVKEDGRYRHPKVTAVVGGASKVLDCIHQYCVRTSPRSSPATLTPVLDEYQCPSSSVVASASSSVVYSTVSSTVQPADVTMDMDVDVVVNEEYTFEEPVALESVPVEEVIENVAIVEDVTVEEGEVSAIVEAPPASTGKKTKKKHHHK